MVFNIDSLSGLQPS